MQGPTSIPASTTLRFGTFNGQNNFTGVLDEIAIYGRALGSNEINQIFQAGTSGVCRSK